MPGSEKTTQRLPVFSITRLFDAPRDMVWRAWTDPVEIAHWFGPKGSATKVIRHELRAGGVLHSSIYMPGGPEMFGLFTYLEVKPQSRLVWRHSFADARGAVVRHPFSENWPLELLTTVTFAEDGDDTSVTLQWTPNNATQAEIDTFAAAMPSMEGGWSGSFDQLDELLA